MQEKWLIKIKWLINLKNNIARTTYDEIKFICTKFQHKSGVTDLQLKTILRELYRVWEKDLMAITTLIGTFK